jgi:hypothetical protein
VLSLLLVLGLLGGTAAAFAVTEGLKGTKSPVFQTRVTNKVFSPTCRCSTDHTEITFNLRRADRLTLAIENAQGRTVRLLFENRPVSAGLHTFRWDGLLDRGGIAPDGAYKPRLELTDADRSILLPSQIVVDTVPPVVTLLGASLGRKQLVVRYRVNEPARGLLFAGGERIVKTYRRPLTGVIRVSAGLARGKLALAAADLAGNRSKLVPFEAGPVQ